MAGPVVVTREIDSEHKMEVLETILQQLKAHDELRRLSLTTIMAFVSRAASLKRDIMQPQPLSVTDDRPPDILPPSIAHFLSNSLAIPLASIQDCWGIFKFDIWDHQGPEEARKADEVAFRIYGLDHGFSKSPRI